MTVSLFQIKRLTGDRKRDILDAKKTKLDVKLRWIYDMGNKQGKAAPGK